LRSIHQEDGENGKGMKRKVKTDIQGVHINYRGALGSLTGSMSLWRRKSIIILGKLEPTP